MTFSPTWKSTLTSLSTGCWWVAARAERHFSREGGGGQTERGVNGERRPRRRSLERPAAPRFRGAETSEDVGDHVATARPILELEPDPVTHPDVVQHLVVGHAEHLVAAVDRDHDFL